MKKTLLFKSILAKSSLLVAALVVSGSANSQLDTIQIGSATTSTTGTGQSVFGTFYHDNKNQLLFTAAELNAAGYAGGFIFGVAFEVSSAQPQVMNNFEVQMMHSSLTSITGFESGLSTHHVSNHTATPGWNYLDFSSPFIWDGTSNIIVQTCFDNTSYTSNSGVYYTSTTSTSNVYGYNDSFYTDPCTNQASNGSTTQRPNIKFVVAPPYTLDAGISSIDSPSVPACALGDSVWATLANYGTDTLTTVAINWSINGTPQTSFAWTGNLGYGQTESVLVGTGTILDGDNLEVWTAFPNGGTEPAGASYNDSVPLLVKEGLSGTKFITPTGVGDYVSISDAVADLAAFGVCGPTTFIVSNDTYNERVEIPDFQNASGSTVRFTGLNGNTVGTILTYTSTGSGDNGVLYLNGGDHVQFDHMTISNGATSGSYSAVIMYENGAHHNTFDSLIILGNPSSTTTSQYASCILSNGSVDTNNVFSNNQVDGGSTGYYIRGNSTIDLEKNTVITNNEFTNFYYRGGYSYYSDNMELSYNTAMPDLVTPYTFTKYGFYFGYAYNSPQIHHNRTVEEGYGYGIYCFACDGLATKPAYIYDNVVSLGSATSTSSGTGIYFSSCNNIVIHSNSVYTNSNASFTECIYTSGSNMTLHNNNLVNDGPGYAIYISSGPSVSDNNNFYAPNGYVAYASGNQTTLADLQAATGMDLNSVSTNPAFAAFDDLTTCNDTLDMAGVADTIVVDDYEGNIRSAVPDIGAYEFDGISSFTIGADTMICSTDNLVLGNPYSNSSWIWNTGSPTNTITVNTPGTYIAQITNSCGTGVDTMVLGNLPDPSSNFNYSTSYYTGIFNDNSIAADSYLWDFGDGNTDTSQNPLHLYGATGWYEVSLTITGICGTSTFTDSVFIFINSVDEVESIEFSMYPNPANENITVTASAMLSNAIIEVMDATGRIVMTENVSGNQFGLDISQLEAGPYFIRITDEGKTNTQRLIVK